MPRLITKPTIIHAAGTPPKRIEEFVGRVNSQTHGVNIARMHSPGGWSEPGQTPEFDEYTVVLKGILHVKTHGKDYTVHAGEAIVIEKGTWVRYSTPDPTEQSISPCACLRFRPIPLIVIKTFRTEIVYE